MGEPIPVRAAKKFNTELTDYSIAKDDGFNSSADEVEVDALVVGAGFAGVFMLKTLRDKGYNTVIYEAGNDLGGTWRWNCYPGAMVDSEVPVYEFSWAEVWKTWNWPSNYPTYDHLRAYFDHVDSILHIKKDCSFNTVVTGATFDTDDAKWTVRTEDGRRTKTRFLILGTGFAARRYIPDWPGIESFKGEIHHSSFWPDAKMDVKNKRCAIIGTGASGVQITQAWGPQAGHLTVFQRTPNLALPIHIRDLSVDEQEHAKKWYPELFLLRERNFAGFLYEFHQSNTFDHTPEEREAVYAKAWKEGGFRFWLNIHKDYLFNEAANRQVYNFWARQVRARIGDARKRDLLAPLEMPHFFGIKRPCLEHNYFEQFNRETVDLVDVKTNPIKEFTETGLMLEDGTHHELDIIAIATGFDSVTGAMTQLGLESTNGTHLQDEWGPGINTYLGLTVPGYPNMFHMYGPHGPTLVSSGPSAVEVQGRWIVNCMEKMKQQNIRYIDAKPEAAAAFKEGLKGFVNLTLFPTTKSTYMGSSIPGKTFEPMCYMKGLPAYAFEIQQALDTMEGFHIVK